MKQLKIKLVKEIVADDFLVSTQIYSNNVHVYRLVDDPKNIYLYVQLKTGVITVARIVMDGSYTEKKSHVEAMRLVTKHGATLKIIFCECSGNNVDDMVDTIFQTTIQMSTSDADAVISDRLQPMTIYNKDGFVQLVRRYAYTKMSSVSIMVHGILPEDEAASAIIQMIYLWCEHAEVVYDSPYTNVMAFLRPRTLSHDTMLGHPAFIEIGEFAKQMNMPDVLQTIIMVNIANVLKYADQTLLERARENGLFLRPADPKPIRRKNNGMYMYTPPDFSCDPDGYYE